MVRDDRQQDAGCPIRLRAALLPVPDGRRREPESCSEFRLTQAKRLAKRSNIDFGSALHADHGDSNRNIRPLGTRDRLLYAANEPAACRCVFPGRSLCGLVRHIRKRCLKRQMAFVTEHFNFILMQADLREIVGRLQAQPVIGVRPTGFL